jgi:hypothetical protein
MANSETEARIRRLHARAAAVEHRVDNLGDRTGRLVQNLAGFTQVGATFGSCVSIIKGRISGFDSLNSPVPGSTVQILGGTSGIDYGTYAAPTGDFEIPISTDASDISINLIVTGPSPWFVPSNPYFFNMGSARCGVGTYGYSSPSGPVLPGKAAAGYKQMTNPVQAGGWVEFDSVFPLAETLNYSHSLFGTGTMVSAGGGIHYGPCVDYSFPSFTYSGSPTSCAAVSSPVKVCLYHEGHFTLAYVSGGLSSCPVASTCATVFSFGLGHMPVVILSKQYTDGTVKFDWTYKVPAGTNAWHGHSDQTLRIWEP